MKCPFCAAQIDDNALRCPACGAHRPPGEWRPADAAPARAKSFTIVSTGWLLLLSAGWSLFSLSSPVAAFGSMRTGAVAVLYQASFAGLFAAMGAALVWRKPWAMAVTLATSLLYTLDKLDFILNERTRVAALGELGSLLGDVEPIAQQAAVVTALLFLLSWWGFVLYLYAKRDYFRAVTTLR